MSDRTKPRYFWIDDFRDYANNSILYSVSRYWVNTGGDNDNGTDLLYRVLDSIPSVSEPARRGKWFRAYDNNVTLSIAAIRQFEKAYVNNHTLRLRVYPKGGNASTVLQVSLLDATTATNIISFRFVYDNVNGWFDVQAQDFGTGFVDTGINVDPDEVSNITAIVNDDDTWQLIINGEVSAIYDRAAYTGGINRLRVNTGPATTGVDFFFDFFDLFEDTKGLQFYNWIASGIGPASVQARQYQDIIELKSGRIFFTSTSGSWYYADPPYSTWNNTGLTLNLTNPVSATVLTNENIWILGGSAGSGAYHVYYSTNQGVSWTAQNITPTTNHKPLFIFSNGTTAYIVTVFSSAAPTSILTVYKDVAGTWTSMATYTVAQNRGLGNTGWGVAPGFHDGSNYYFGMGYDDVATGTTVDFMKYDEGAGTLTKFSEISATPGTMFPQIPLSRSADGNVYYVPITGPQFRLYESRDQGTTWTLAISEASTQIYRLNRRRVVDHLVGTNVNTRVWSFNISPSLNLSYINEGIDYLIKYRKGTALESIASNFAFITPTGTIFAYDPGIGKALVFTLVQRSEILDRATFEYFGYETPARGELVVDPAFIDLIETGDVLEFWDGYDNFIGTYKAQAPVWNDRVGWVIQVVSLWYDLFSRYSNSFDTKNTRFILQTIIDRLKFVYRDNSIDPSTDFTTTYNRRVNEPVTHFIQNWVRQYERALFYVEPDSKARCHRYDRMIKTGLRFFTDHPQIRNISDYRQPDIRLTTSDVIGGWYNTPNGKKELYINYIGDATLLATENEVVITKQDDQISNYDEALKLATNRFNIFNPQTLFVHMYVTNQGFIQPGESIYTSWSDPINNVSIPLQDLLFLYARYDAKNDIYEEMILTSNIVTEDEYYSVKKETERDTTLVSTYSDGDTPATAQQTATRLNPVNRMKAGTYEPRRPEASAPDWNETTLTNDTNWNDLDLSSILPEGIRHADLNIEAYDNLVGATIEFREKGLTGAVQRILLETTITNRVINPSQINVHLNESRVCQIRVTPSPSNWGQIDITVLGGWI